MTTTTLEQTESEGVRLVRLSGSLTQKGVTDVGPAFVAATRGIVRDVLLRCRLDKVLSLAPTPDAGVESARSK